MPFVLALDQGTTSSRAILVDPSGAMRAVAQKEFRQHYPRPGWVEHDPEEIWSSQHAVAVEALRQAGARPDELAAIGITNQRETTVLWERAGGRPIANAIVWQDRRTAGICDRLRAGGHEERVREKSGLVIDAYFSATKVAWLLDNVPGARRRAEAGELAFGTIDSWLVYKLTGGRVHATDASNASRTLLYDIHRGDWDDELMSIFSVPRAVLPELRDSSAIYGEVDRALGLGKAPIAGIAGDQQAALFGQLCLEPGMVKNTYGTGCFLLLNVGSKPLASRHRLLTTVAWKLGGRLSYALEGSVFIAGAVVQWLRDGLGIIRSSEEINRLAASVEDSGGVYLVPAFAGLGAPHWDSYARGALLGLTRGTTAAHIARAALEGIAFQVSDVVGAMAADAGGPIAELRVDGGASRSDFLMQFQADVLQTPLVRPRVQETTALGAAYLAGLAAGVWKSPAALAGNWQVERRFEPRLDPGLAAARRAGWARALERVKGWEDPDAAR
jgi:glycerol kinase